MECYKCGLFNAEKGLDANVAISKDVADQITVSFIFYNCVVT